MSALPTELQMIPIDRIEVLNPRERNNRIFEVIVDNIKTLGLKKPVTVTPRPGPEGDVRYMLICGEGRLKAFKALGETQIPALVVTRKENCRLLAYWWESFDATAPDSNALFEGQCQADIGVPLDYV